MNRQRRIASRCFIAGVGVGFLLSALVYVLNAAHIRYNLDGLFLTLFPPSIGLVATDPLNGHVGPLGQLVIVLILSAANGLLYSLIGYALAAATTRGTASKDKRGQIDS